MINIYFHYTDRSLSIKHKIPLKLFISSIFLKERKEINRIDYIFCSDDYLLNLNRKFLQHDFYTDIITFDLSANQKKIIAEIYISLDRIRDNSKKNKVSLREETYRVIFHGVLHLCGYKDKTKTEIKIMREKENFYLNLYKKSST